MAVIGLYYVIAYSFCCCSVFNLCLGLSTAHFALFFFAAVLRLSVHDLMPSNLRHKLWARRMWDDNGNNKSHTHTCLHANECAVKWVNKTESDFTSFSIRCFEFVDSAHTISPSTSPSQYCIMYSWSCIHSIYMRYHQTKQSSEIYSISIVQCDNRIHSVMQFFPRRNSHTQRFTASLHAVPSSSTNEPTT